MQHEIFNLVIDVVSILFEEVEWNDADYEKIEKKLGEFENRFAIELDNNLFGQNFIVKKDLIRKYIVSIAEIYNNVLNINYDEGDDAPDSQILSHTKAFYQQILNLICYTSLRNDINLRKIIDENVFAFGILDINIYDYEVKNSLLEKGKATTALKNSFANDDCFDFFNYLHENFDNKATPHTKFTCIYRMMIDDGFLGKELESRRFARYLGKKPYYIEFKFDLGTSFTISNKSKREYQKLKSAFFENPIE